MHAAVRADERFQPERHQRLVHLAVNGLAVLALLVGEIHEIGVDPAAFQKTEALQKRLAFQRPPVAADDGQVAGDTVAPKLLLSRGALGAVGAKLFQHRHRRADLFPAHAEMRRARRDHVAPVVHAGDEDALRPALALAALAARAEGKAHGFRLSGFQLQHGLRAHHRARQPAESAVFVGGEAQWRVRREAQPALADVAPAHAPERQHAVRLLGVYAQRPERRVAHIIRHRGEERHERQRERNAHIARCTQRHGAPLAAVAVCRRYGAGPFQLVRAPRYAHALLLKLPQHGRGAGQQRQRLPVDPGGDAYSALRAETGNAAVYRGAAARGARMPGVRRENVVRPV